MNSVAETAQLAAVPALPALVRRGSCCAGRRDAALSRSSIVGGTATTPRERRAASTRRCRRRASPLTQRGTASRIKTVRGSSTRRSAHAVKTFIGTAVAREHVDQSWDVVAPTLKAGYTHGASGRRRDRPAGRRRIPGVDTNAASSTTSTTPPTKDDPGRGRRSPGEAAASSTRPVTLPARPRARRSDGQLARRLLDAALDAAGPRRASKPPEL